MSLIQDNLFFAEDSSMILDPRDADCMSAFVFLYKALVRLVVYEGNIILRVQNVTVTLLNPVCSVLFVSS